MQYTQIDHTPGIDGVCQRALALCQAFFLSL